MAVADLFRLADSEARKIISDVSSAVASWRRVASSYGLDKSAIAAMAPAFEHRQAELATDLLAASSWDTSSE
jgi:hypothetical protein